MENKQNRAMQKKIKEQELADNTKWTRAKLAQTFKDAVAPVIYLTGDDEATKILMRDWSFMYSVSFNWFYCLLAHIQKKPKMPDMSDTENIVKNTELVLGDLLDLVDSVMDRTIILLTAAGMSHNSIGRIYAMHRQTISRRHTKALDMLAYRLNHDKCLNWRDYKKDRFELILSQMSDNSGASDK